MMKLGLGSVNSSALGSSSFSAEMSSNPDWEMVSSSSSSSSSSSWYLVMVKILLLAILQ